MREAARLFFEEKGEKYERWKASIKETTHLNLINLTAEEKDRRSKLISAGRHAMSQEAKEKRAKNITEAFKASEKRKKFNSDMRIKRLGVNNPNARIVTWLGEKFNQRDFKKFVKENNITKEELEYNFLNKPDCYYPPSKAKHRETVECPHCLAIGKNNSTFKRWHFKNCKQKVKDD